MWSRELLSARDPPRITCDHREYEEVIDTKKDTIISYEYDDMVHQSFFFGPTEIASLRCLVPLDLAECTRFEVLTACIWYRCTKALQIEPKEDVCMMCIVNARARFNLPLLASYYGNVFAFLAAVTTARKLCGNSFGYAVDLIKKAKVEVTEEYMHSAVDFLVTKGRPLFTTTRSCIVSYVASFGFRKVDFGWGTAVYGEPAKARAGNFLGATFVMAYENVKGEDGLLFPIYLAAKAMRRFEKELDDMLGKQNQLTKSGEYPLFTKSTM